MILANSITIKLSAGKNQQSDGNRLSMKAIKQKKDSCQKATVRFFIPPLPPSSLSSPTNSA